MDTFEKTNTEFVRYCVPVQITNTTSNDSVSNIKLAVDSSKEKENYQVIKISAIIKGEKYNDYLLNILDKTSGAIYSYPLVIKGDELSGFAIWRNNTWECGNTSRYIVGRDNDRCEELADITNEPIPYE